MMPRSWSPVRMNNQQFSRKSIESQMFESRTRMRAEKSRWLCAPT